MFITAKEWDQPKCLSIGDKLNNWWCSNIMQYYEVIKKSTRTPCTDMESLLRYVVTSKTKLYCVCILHHLLIKKEENLSLYLLCIETLWKNIKNPVMVVTYRTGWCSGLNCVPLHTHPPNSQVKFYPLVPQHVTLFGERVITDIIS